MTDINAYHRAYYARNREKIRARQNELRSQLTPEQVEARRARDRALYNKEGSYRSRHRQHVLKYRYGLTPEQYAELLEASKGRCAICHKPFKGEPVIDHCHETGMTRGLLCNNCNAAEGFIGTPENALRLYHYMLKNELFYKEERN